MIVKIPSQWMDNISEIIERQESQKSKSDLTKQDIEYILREDYQPSCGIECSAYNRFFQRNKRNSDILLNNNGSSPSTDTVKSILGYAEKEYPCKDCAHCQHYKNALYEVSET